MRTGASHMVSRHLFIPKHFFELYFLYFKEWEERILNYSVDVILEIDDDRDIETLFGVFLPIFHNFNIVYTFSLSYDFGDSSW